MIPATDGNPLSGVNGTRTRPLRLRRLARPGAVLGLREPRRKELTFDLATLYTKTLLQEAWDKAQNKKHNRILRRK